MYTATILVSIDKFTPIANGNTAATLGTPIDTSPNAPTGVFSGSGEKLIVKTPPGYTGSVQVTFQLPGADYVLLGIAVDPNSAGPGAGSQELRTVVVSRDPSGSQMTVTNACIPAYYGVNFEYLLIIQELATNQIGTIDPDEENEPQ